MARILTLLAAVAVFVSVQSAHGTELDTDKNGATDIARGGTNAKTASGARTALGLGAVDNTRDVDKPVSAATQAALNALQSSTDPSLYAGDPAYAGGMKCDYDGTTGTDDTAALNAVIAAAAAGTSRNIILPPGRCKVVVPSGGVAVQLNVPGIEFHGQGGYRPETRGGTSIDAVGGPGVVFQNGTDNGHDWDANDYDGPQFVTFKDMIIRYRGANLTMGANGIAQYGTGVTGVKDWRGGDVRLVNAALELFETGFWGINSDFSKFHNVNLNYNHVGAYFGPRSDQIDLQDVSGFFNDTLIWLDGVVHPDLEVDFTFNGSPTTPALKITSSAWSYPTDGVTCNQCWFENGGGAQEGMNSFAEIGIGDTTPVKSVVFKNPTFINSVVGLPTNVPYFATVGNVQNVTIDTPTNAYGEAFTHYFKAVGSTSPLLLVLEDGGEQAPAILDNTGTGSPSAIRLKPAASNTLALDGALTTSGTVQTPNVLIYKGTDAGVTVTFRAGSTADQNEFLIFQDRTGATKYSLGYDALGIFTLNDSGGYARFLLNGSETRMQLPDGGRVGIRNSAGVEQASISDTGIIKGGGGLASHAICWKSDGKTLGYCSSVVAADGGCTCN